MTGEKKERRKWRPWLLASLGAMLLILGAWWLWGGPRLWTELSFRLWQDRYAAAAEAALAGDPWRDVPGVRALNVWPKDGAEDVLIADFALGSWGMGSSTSYWGVCTTTDGRPAGFQGMDMTLTEEAPGVFSWREAEGDNAYQTWELDEGWYGYLMKF